MTTVVVAQRMWQRRDTAANWTSVNPVLAAGEIGFQIDAGQPTKMKVGDGTAAWNSLSQFNYLNVGAQQASAELSAIAALSTTGFLKRTATATYLAAALVAADIPNLDAAKITSGTFDNARVAASNVTQHQAALSINYSQLTGTPPPLLITKTSVVASQAAQLALTAQEGDVAVRTDLNKSYIHNGGTAGTMADWTELLTPTDAVLSFNGRVGAITLTSADVTTALTYTPLNAASYTAADVLAKLLTVDGSGSGLDADTLDGINASAFQLASGYTAADVLAKLLTVDGSGSGLDADLLDGQDSTYYRNAGNINAGTLAVARGGTGIASYTANNYIRASGATTLEQRTPSQVLSDIGALASASYTAADVLAKLLAVDGSGSGIDADLLDGQHGAYYRDAANINAGTLAVARGGTGLASYTTGNYVRASAATTLEQRTPSQVLSDIGAEPAVPAGSTAGFWRGDKTFTADLTNPAGAMQLRMTAYGSSSNFVGGRVNGTVGAETATSALQQLSGMSGFGHDGAAETNNRVRMRFLASQNWISTSTPTEILFDTTPVGAVAPLTRWTIQDDGAFVPNGSIDIGTSAARVSTYYGTGVNLTGTVIANSYRGLGAGHDLAIYQNTPDGADDGRVRILGGGATSNTRGAYILIHGNEFASDPGKLMLASGVDADVRIVGSGAGSIAMESTTGAVTFNGNAVYHGGNAAPGTLTASTTNAVSGGTHTHAITGFASLAAANVFNSLSQTVEVASGLGDWRITVGGSLAGGIAADLSTPRAILYASTGGSLQLRPDGRGSATGQVTITTASATFNGTVAVAGGSSSGAWYETGTESPASWAANVNDLAVAAGTRTLRVQGTAARDLTGIVPGSAGRLLRVCNIGTFNITLKHNLTSTAANRFFCPGSVDLVLTPNSSVELWYDTTSSRWRVIR